MKNITISMLFIELLKYGSFSSIENGMKYVVDVQFEEYTDFSTITQKTKDVRQFFKNCAVGFQTGFNPIFDKISW